LNEDKNVLLLTDQEWDDLEEISTHYLLCTDWYERNPNSGHIGGSAFRKAHAEKVGRQRVLCKRIIKANS